MAIAVKTAPTPTLSLPRRLAYLLTRPAPTPDPELALRKVLTEYLDLKIAAYQFAIEGFEAKWGMDFAQACVDDTLGIDPYSYEAESDYWE